jgi:prepilin-type N-terminal cleavage/methylation domain-containing protein
MKRHHSKKGFTLIELLVAITLFSIAISVAIGGFVRALRTQRELISLIAANSNVSLAIEQMAREMRTGKDFHCSNGSRFCDTLTFTNAESDTVTYAYHEISAGDGYLTREAGSAGPEAFTAENVRIAYLHFDIPPTIPARVTIALGVGVHNPELQGNVTNIETTVSSRAF